MTFRKLSLIGALVTAVATRPRAPPPRPRFRLRRYAAPPEPRDTTVAHYWLPDPGALFGSC